MSGTTSLLVGTTKGAFILTADAERRHWEVSGPHCDGWPINHMTADAESGTIWAGGGGDWHGAGIWRSDDGGATWTLSRLSTGQMDRWAAEDADFAAMIGWQDTPAPFGDSLQSVWALHHAHGKLFAGTKPAQLLVSGDGGTTWEMNGALAGFADREAWNPGAAGLTLHTLVSDPDDPEKFWIAISAAGVFATSDAGKTWERRNRLSNAGACGHHDHPAAPRNGETGHCVHNMVRGADPHSGSELLYQQNHHGVYRSRDGGHTWDDITSGLPSTFGFPIAVHPHDPETIWVVPLNGDMQGRYPPGASAAVWISTDGGETWAAQHSGLPEKNCYFTVLRQAMTTDRQIATGVYFGTNTGSVFASIDGGDTWDEIARHLPTILGIEAFDRH
ncbi:exo-alpha-sialidase [Roseibacterium sp. SDUM158016]|uniref:WD40/YVTN/BNR-like repeat-containing protein n=1 Tax=Roseicyclus sediminis TaxID=2980997 RepID=UPI0021CFDE34|nr:exo-alpha-sialidase [Roseibacterium sp. SDUM158016]MCU4651242.1 exo-alpha-sialidase [Roseibacterium sp. SDUM158016]